jgi:hypothetical protein
MLRRLLRIIEDPARLKRAIQRRMPGVVSAGGRAVAKRVKYNGLVVFKKKYGRSPDAVECFRGEVSARRIFGEKNWIIPILEQGDDWMSLPYLPDESRLDRAAQKMNENTRLEVARQALVILLDIHTEGYAHCDFHSHNLFWYKDQLLAGDFEKLTAYPENGRPPFCKSFDLTGSVEGISVRGNPDSPPMYYSADTPTKKSVELILKVPLKQAIDALEDSLTKELKEICAAFQSRENRHWIRAKRIYNSFSLPYFSVDPAISQRNSGKRLRRVDLNETDLNDASLLDLGCNIGGSLFEAQKFGPGKSMGVEFDGDKVALASKIAAYNGLNNVSFMQANVDETTVEDLKGPYDVVFCLALIGHVLEKDRLYQLLGKVTNKLLFFEGNLKTTQEEVEAKLHENGFSEVNFIGLCDDDCMPGNNTRPIYIARK